MAMSAEERQFLETQLSEKYKWFNTGSRAWSLMFNWSLVASAVLSATAAVVIKIKALQTGLDLSDENIKDIVAITSAAATLVTALAAGGGFGRKWQANRISRGRVDRLRIEFASPNADAQKIRDELCDVLHKHDEAIVGAPVK